MFDVDEKTVSLREYERAGVGKTSRDGGRPQAASADAASLRKEILSRLAYDVGKRPEQAADQDWFTATALAVRDYVVDAWNRSADRTASDKRVCYLSLEFLIGRLLGEAIGNLGLAEPLRQALADLGVDFSAVVASEPDAALGNGGLGRLAACFMESMATTGVVATGYGIRYDYGLFRQSFLDGRQQEAPDNWLARGNPWEFPRADVTYRIGFGGGVTMMPEQAGVIRHVWEPSETVLAVAHDTPVVGWRGRQVNFLRLWAARATDPLQLAAFNAGDHVGAQADQARAEAISRVLYPGDATPQGQELRLRQEYFFTSASLQDLLRTHLERYGDLASLPEHAAVQMNDTHPAIAVAELMRLLVDVHEFHWGDAWRITTQTLNYTNHTLLPEALETWPVELMERLLPRHLQIIYLINWLHLGMQQEQGRLNAENVASFSLIDETNGRRVRMGHLAFLGSNRVNGVSALHTELMRQTVFKDLHGLYPDRIVNKTNGITVRRWLHQANPGLMALLAEAIGPLVLDDIDRLRDLEPLADDSAFQQRFAAERRRNKVALARIIEERVGISVDPAALFDSQVKRIHEYKRQLLNVLETIALYQAIREEPDADWVPRVKILGGKAAPGYERAKLIIKLAHDVAQEINADLVIAGRLKVAFLPNYNVSLAEAIMPGSDLSEQISTAGLEASGTGNMKFALNGALTIGTLDGANIEIMEQIGADNIAIFGLTAEEVAARRRIGLDATADIAASRRLSDVLSALAAGAFSPDDVTRYRGLVEALTFHDPYMVAADFEAYWCAQRSVDELWRNPEAWWRKSILSTARMGWFSSDRTIREYAKEIWRTPGA
ncbi:glycogen/starch/alpha-glucan phosphorylase [Microvirga massiliensis]|uniref:glycogen/starch/alpha-glucan phosphorylase n=1 Tax=Microvirga massiliensis TaxID=1033741 RepID=UPI0009E56F6A|nr:glycogen/starch/alpha-glucan phosphorylase [Microvirga massiliensis]